MNLVYEMVQSLVLVESTATLLSLLGSDSVNDSKGRILIAVRFGLSSAVRFIGSFLRSLGLFTCQLQTFDQA